MIAGECVNKYILTVTMNPALDQFVAINTRGAKDFSGEPVLSAGGKGINVARTLKQLGSTVCATGLRGGRTGTLIARKLREEKIAANFSAVEKPSRINRTSIDHQHKKIHRMIEAGEQASPVELKNFKIKYNTLLVHSRMVVLSGRNAAGAPQDFYADLIRQAARKDVPVCLDTSGPAFKSALRAAPFLIKPNLGEAEDAIGRPLNSVKKIKIALKRFHGYGIKIVLLTLGREGAVASNGAEIFLADGSKKESLYEVGCGDAFLGGFIHAYFKGWDFKAGVKFAAACGRANTATVIPGLVDKKNVNKIFNQIKIKSIA